MQYMDELDDFEEQRDHDDDRIETWRNRVAIPVLVTLLVLSLLLHALTLGSLLRVRTVAIGQIDALVTYTEQVEQDTINITIPINQSVPIQAKIPFNQKLSIPIRTNIPISDTVNVTTPLGNIPLPIQLNFPVNLQVPVEINQSVDVSTTVELNLNVPISIPVKETPVSSYLNELRQALRSLSAGL